MKLSRILFFLISVLLAVPSIAAAVEHKEIAIANITEVDISGCHLKVKFVVGEQEYVKIDASEKIIKDINLQQKDSLLTIKDADASKCDLTRRFTHKPEVVIGLKSVSLLRLQGFIDAKLAFEKEGITLNDLGVTMHGSSSLEVKSTAHVKNLILTIYGFSNFDGENLQAENGVVKVNGFSEAKVNVNGDLDAQSDGISSIYYYGMPRLSKSVKGLGYIHAK